MAVFVVVILLARTAAVAGDGQEWRTIANERFGFLFSYPAAIFTSQEPSANGDGIILTSADGKGRVLVYAVNAPRAEPASRTVRRLADRGEPAETTYVRHGRTWAVVSGYVQGRKQIFFTRLTLACDGRVQLVMDMEYPSSQRRRYDAFLAHMVDSLRPGPTTCRNR